MVAPPVLAFLGTMSVTRAGAPVALPPSQKTRALLAYLAVTQRSHSRERLCTMFWDVADDPRGSLRWSLSKLRVLDDKGATRVRADRQSVSFDAESARIDVLEVRGAVAAGLAPLSLERLRELVDLFRGDFLEGLTLPDFDAFEAWRIAERTELRTLHRRLLGETLARVREHPVEVAPLARELVRLSPDDESARATLVRALAAAGRRDEAEEHYQLGLRQLAKSEQDRGELRRAFAEIMARPVGVAAPTGAPAAVDATVAGPTLEPPRQEVRFCVAPDGVRIATAVLGQGPPLVKTANWMTHLEYDWKSPLWRHFSRELSRDFRLVRYDSRGNGLSDWDVEDFSLDACVGDLEAVVDGLGLARFPLLGISQGCRVAVAFAARHPERVSRLVLYGGSARGFLHRDPSARATREALQALIREGWGKDIPAFLQVFTTLFMPGATRQQMAWFNELQRASTSPENALKITQAFAEIDVTNLLGTLRAPTLVLHAHADAMVPFEEGRRTAAAIPDARFVALESQNHLLLEDEPAFGHLLGEIRAFLASDAR
jgi:pimeloyl-ACP methyl ester carboxylesterase/DNA-binding SARP family transcriptional activator